MNDQDLFGELRALLHLPYEQGRWHQISALLGAWSDQDALEHSVLPYVKAALKRWPQARELRYLPARWLESAYELWQREGRLPAYFSLVEQVSFSHFLSEPSKRLALKLLELPWRSQLESIILIHSRELGLAQALITSLLEHAPLPKLKVLSLSWCKLEDEALKPLLLSAVMASVEELDLSGNQLSVRFVELLAQSAHLSKLRCLDLSYTRYAGATLAGLSQSRSLGALEQIKLDGLTLGEQGFDALFTLPVFSTLKSLTLSGDFPTSSASLVALESAAWNDTLEELTINFGQARAPALEVLARRASKLSTLRIPLHQLTVDELGRLMRSSWRLMAIDLSHPSGLEAGDFGVLSHAPALAQLHELNLSMAHLNQDDFSALAKAQMALDRLYLNGVSCDVRSYMRLGAAPWFGQLKALSLDECVLLDEAVAALLAAKPPLSELSLSFNALSGSTLLQILSAPFLAKQMKRLTFYDAKLSGLAALGEVQLPTWQALRFLNLANNELNDEDIWWLLTRLKVQDLTLPLQENPISGELFDRLHHSPLLRNLSYLMLDDGVDFERHKQLLLSSPYAMPWLEVVASGD